MSLLSFNAGYAACVFAAEDAKLDIQHPATAEL
jgi:hypothetical protein